MPHTPINQLNIPAIFAAAQGIKRSQLEIEGLQTAREREGRIGEFTAGAVRGDPSSALGLAGLDPSKAGAATDFFRENVLPGVLSRARSVLESSPEAFAESYGTFVDDLTKSKLLDPDDPPPPDPDRAFIERVIADGVALQNQDAGRPSIERITAEAEAKRPSIERLEEEAAAKRPSIERIGAETEIKLLAKAKVLNQLLQAAGAEPLPEAEGEEPGQIEGPAISTPFGPQEAASEDSQEVASLFLAARRLLLVGETGMANNLLSQARFITENSTDIQRQQELDKSISADLASELGVPVGTTIREVLGSIPPSPEQVSESRAVGAARGRGTVEGEEQLAFIDDAQTMIGDLLEEIEVDPGIVGIRGSLRSTGQTAIGVLGDLRLDALVETGRDLAFENVGLDQVTEWFESPTLSVLSILENSIGLILARLQTPTGRIPVDVIKRSIADMQLTGVKASKQIANRLKFILGRFDRRAKSIRKRFPALEKSDVPRLRVEGGVLVPMEQ